MLAKAWELLGRYSNHLMGLAALFTIIGLGVGPLWNFISGPSLLAKFRTSDVVAPPDLLQWSRNVASNLPTLEGTLKTQQAAIEQRKTSDRSLLSMELEDKHWAEVLHTYNDPKFLEKIRMTRFESPKYVWIQLRNPSRSDMKHIRVRVEKVRDLWSIDMTGTFLNQEEAAALRANTISTGDDGITLPEIPVLPSGGTIDVNLYAVSGSFFSPQLKVTAESADVKVVEILALEENWFLDLYRNEVFRIILVILTLSIAISVLKLVVEKIPTKFPRQANSDVSQTGATLPPSQTIDETSKPTT
jgi:hypothetical protein